MASENSKKIILGIFGLGLLAYLLYKLSRKKKDIKIVEISKQQAPTFITKKNQAPTFITKKNQAPTFITKKNEQKIVKKQPSMIEFEVIDRY
jgi:hypothetical protein